ncbi:MAG: hypothetical protein BWY95_02443 [Bacteroidetes bacterium ADurb.BinA104]|nr:MAG: hypothetical protein BWY95_02443 [Bacteroidetes bacterium ADurb.BinA104]
MDEIDRRQLYRTAWKHWGAELQINMVMEEMAEFTQAILKTRRAGVTYSYSFFDEMADVLICLEQLETVLKDFPDGKGGSLWDDVMGKKEAKLKRLYDRLMDELSEGCDDIANQIFDHVR